MNYADTLTLEGIYTTLGGTASIEGVIIDYHVDATAYVSMVGLKNNIASIWAGFAKNKSTKKGLPVFNNHGISFIGKPIRFMRPLKGTPNEHWILITDLKNLVFCSDPRVMMTGRTPDDDAIIKAELERQMARRLVSALNNVTDCVIPDHWGTPLYNHLKSSGAANSKQDHKTSPFHGMKHYGNIQAAWWIHTEYDWRALIKRLFDQGVLPRKPN